MARVSREVGGGEVNLGLWGPWSVGTLVGGDLGQLWKGVGDSYTITSKGRLGILKGEVSLYC